MTLVIIRCYICTYLNTQTMATYRVAMESEVFGVEYFMYDTKKEANKGMARVKKAAKKYEKIDGIKRKVYLDD